MELQAFGMPTENKERDTITTPERPQSTQTHPEAEADGLEINTAVSAAEAEPEAVTQRQDREADREERKDRAEQPERLEWIHHRRQNCTSAAEADRAASNTIKDRQEPDLPEAESSLF